MSDRNDAHLRDIPRLGRCATVGPGDGVQAICASTFEDLQPFVRLRLAGVEARMHVLDDILTGS